MNRRIEVFLSTCILGVVVFTMNVFADETHRKLSLTSNTTRTSFPNYQPLMRSCKNGSKQPDGVVSNLAPVRGIMVSCVRSSLPRQACINLVETLLKDTDKSVNITVFYIMHNMNTEFGSQLTKLKNLAKEKKRSLELLPIIQTNQFIRDHFLPYFTDGKLSLLHGFDNQNWTRSSLVQSLAQNLQAPFSVEVGLHKTVAPQPIVTSSEVLKTKPLESYLNQLSMDDVEQLINSGSQSKFGNFLPLPNGGLAYGILHRDGTGGFKQQPPDPFLLELLKAKGIKLYPVYIPDLDIGHIDEVVQIIPAKTECGSAILRASPLKMAKFLKASQRNLNHTLYQPIRNIIADYFEQSNLSSKIALLNGEYQLAMKNRRASDVDLLLEQLKISARQYRDLELPQKAVSLQDYLNEPSHQLIDDLTKGAAESVRAAIRTQMGNSTCDIPIYDIPVLWGIGRPFANSEYRNLIPAMGNPINGLYVNGTYLYSQAHRMVGLKHKEELGVDSYWLAEEVQFERDLEIEKFVAAELRKAGLNSVAVDTRGYDSGGGGIHCATLELRGCE